MPSSSLRSLFLCSFIVSTSAFVTSPTKRSFITMSATSSESSPVVVVGSANQDLTAYTAKVPAMGETVLGSDFKTSFGGKGANQAVAASALTSVRMVCKVGDDLYGTALLDNFRETGVAFDESTVFAEKGIPTGVAPITVDTTTGDNTIIVVPGANHALTPKEVRDAITKASPKVVVTQLEILDEASLEAMIAGRDVGAITILNPAPAPKVLNSEYFKCVDILIPNETELKELYAGATGDSDTDDEETMAKALLEKGISKAVVVTLGARGAMIVTSDDVTLVNAPSGLPCEKDPVISTVGAGDSFCGSLAAYLSRGCSLEDSASRACGCASMSVRKLGAQSSYPTAEELPEVLKLDFGGVTA